MSDSNKEFSVDKVKGISNCKETPFTWFDVLYYTMFIFTYQKIPPTTGIIMYVMTGQHSRSDSLQFPACQ